MMTHTEDQVPCRPGKVRVLKWCLGVLAGVVILAWIALAVAVRHAGPYLREQVIRDLDSRFGAEAELGVLNVSAFPRFRVTGENLTLQQGGDPQPFLSIPHFSVQVSPWELLRRPIHIDAVHLDGLSIVLPPRGERPKLTSSHGSQQQTGTQQPEFVIGRLISNTAHLEILPSKAGKLPLVFDIRNLTLASAGPGQAMRFTAELTNPKPLGDISTNGEFGPWAAEEPRDTPISGIYSFMNADLGTIKGIGGILKSEGQFSGVLDQIEVRGQTDTPNFLVTTGNHAMPLHTDFDARVDGTTGDTYLHPVNARLGSSTFTASGSVLHENGGHRITLDVSSGNTRIQDLLTVAVKTTPPALSGPVTFHASFVLPPGGASVPDRLRLDGSFHLTEVRFLHPGVQDKLDKLSARASGNPKEAQQDDAPDVLSELQGKFTLGDGVISVPSLTFQIPGGLITLAGNYQLKHEEFSFEGQARPAAKLSQMTTGVKSFLLRLADPFFSKPGAGTVLRIKISGTGDAPRIGLEFGRPHRNE